MKSMMTEEPARVVLEELPDGQRAVLRRDIAAGELDGQTVYTFEEVAFRPERRVTVEELEKDFDAWWAFGESPAEVPTVERRLAALEDAMAEMMGVSGCSRL